MNPGNSLPVSQAGDLYFRGLIAEIQRLGVAFTREGVVLLLR